MKQQTTKIITTLRWPFAVVFRSRPEVVERLREARIKKCNPQNYDDDSENFRQKQ